MSNPDSPWIVLKFGGTSVSTKKSWNNIRQIIVNHRENGVKPLVVCSALSSVSNKLDQAFTLAEQQEDFEFVYQQIVNLHLELCQELKLNPPSALKLRLQELRTLLQHVQSLEQAGPRYKAQVMSYGELLSTLLGHSWLQHQGLNISWLDARQLLNVDSSEDNPARHYLTAHCDHEFEAALKRRLHHEVPEMAITQGFIASDSHGDTVLLGRGGSDTSAALLAARIGALELEIWTDVPGMYTANPRLIKDARLIEELDYDEAEIMAYRGAKVLHPRSLAPVKAYNIPLSVRCTMAPWHRGTRITRKKLARDQGRVRAISARDSLCLISARRVDYQLESYEFMSRVTEAFQSNGIGIHNMTTSAEQISVTLDTGLEAVDSHQLQQAVDALEEFSSPEVHHHVASVSLIGNSIGSALHEIGPALEPVCKGNLRQMIYGSDNRDITLLVSQDNTDDIVSSLHEQLIEATPHDSLGASWSEFKAQTQQRQRVLASAAV